MLIPEAQIFDIPQKLMLYPYFLYSIREASGSSSSTSMPRNENSSVKGSNIQEAHENDNHIIQQTDDT